MKKEMIGSVPVEKLLGMQIDLFSKLRSGALTVEELDLFLKHQNPFTSPSTSIQSVNLIADWQKFYQDESGITADLSEIRVPGPRNGFGRKLCLVQGLTTQEAYDRCAAAFSCWKYTSESLDTAVPTNDRYPTGGSYAILVRDVVEADQQHRNKSADDIQAIGILGITLLERLIFELKYFRETGKHLDIQNVTLCAGSRYSDGSVPRVDWFYGRLRVDYFRPGHARDHLRAREVVS